MKYRDHFNHLGEPWQELFRISDLIICSIAFGVIAAIASGVLA